MVDYPLLRYTGETIEVRWQGVVGLDAVRLLVDQLLRFEASELLELTPGWSRYLTHVAAEGTAGDKAAVIVDMVQCAEPTHVHWRIIDAKGEPGEWTIWLRGPYEAT